MTETALAVQNGNGHAPVQDPTFTPAQVQLIKDTVARGATNEELALFLTTATRLGLDPFRPGEIYFIKRRVKVPGANGFDEWKEVGVTQLGIEYYRIVAGDSPDYAGQTTPFWCGPDGAWRDIWLSEVPPAACKVGVFRRGCREATWGIARYKSFVQTRKDKKTGEVYPIGQWATMPEHMLAICAEKQALRKALPRFAREMDQRNKAEVLSEEDTAEPMMVDTSTGEVLMLPSGPAYTEEKPNAPWMRKIHQAGDDKGLNHEDIHDLAIGMLNSNPKTASLGYTSLSQFSEAALEGLLRYIERTDAATLHGRVMVFRHPAAPAITDGSWTSNNGASENYNPETEAHSQQVPDEEPYEAPEEPGEKKGKKAKPAAATVCQDCKVGITDEQARDTAAAYSRRLCPKCAFKTEKTRQEIARAHAAGEKSDPAEDPFDGTPNPDAVDPQEAMAL